MPKEPDWESSLPIVSKGWEMTPWTYSTPQPSWASIMWSFNPRPSSLGPGHRLELLVAHPDEVNLRAATSPDERVPCNSTSVT